MDAISKNMLREILADLKVDLILGGFNQVEATWQDIDYIPEYNKFYFILDGVGWLNVDGVDYYPTAGELYLMPQGILQSYGTTDKENTFTKYWIHFTAKIGEMNLFDLIKTPLHIKVSDYNHISNLFNQINETHLLKDCLTEKLLVQAYLYQLISYYLENVDVGQITIQNTADIKRISFIIDYINQHIGFKSNIRRISRHGSSATKLFHSII